MTKTTAYPRIIDAQPFREIADEVGALFLFDAAHIAGLIAGGAHPSPVPYADVVTFTTHKTLRGPRGGCIVSTAEHATAIDKAVFPGLQGGPLEHVIAAKAVAFHEAAQPEKVAAAVGLRVEAGAQAPRCSPDEQTAHTGSGSAVMGSGSRSMIAFMSDWKESLSKGFFPASIM